jgi:DNA-binding XRE family transcriptional regulator
LIGRSIQTNDSEHILVAKNSGLGLILNCPHGYFKAVIYKHTQLRDFEIDEKGAAPWRVPVQDLIDKYIEPGVVLRGARGKEGLTQTELAERLGIPGSNISEMEHGKRPIGKKMAKRLATALKIDYKVFL